MNKISCEKCLDLIDNRADDDSKNAVTAHIENCTECREYYHKSHTTNGSNKIKKQLYWGAIILIMAGILFGSAVVGTELVFHNILIIPALGLITYFLLKNKVLFGLLVVFITIYIRFFLSELFLAVSSLDEHSIFLDSLFGLPFTYSFIFSALFFLGIITGFLLNFGLKKKNGDKKIIKIVSVLIAIVLIGIDLYFANMLVGNPVSKILAKNAVQNHLDTHYSDKDYIVDKLAYDFKDTDYYAHIISPSSIDSHFSIRISMLGKIIYDTSENISNGYNTAARIYIEYRDVVESVLEDDKLSHSMSYKSGTLRYEFLFEEELTSQLILDKQYDLNEFGKLYGQIRIVLIENEVSIERMSEILLDTKNKLDEKEIGFYDITLSLRNESREEHLYISELLYTDIYEEGLVDRIENALIKD